MNLCLAVLLGTFAFTACSDVANTNEKKDDGPAEREVTVQQIENPENPFDNEGAVHNKFLDFYEQQMKPGETLTNENALTAVEAFYEENNMELTSENIQAYLGLFRTFQEMGIQDGMAGQALKDICDWLPAFCNPGGVPGGTPPYNPHALNTGGIGAGEGSSATENLLRFVNDLRDTETEILRDKELTEEQRDALLAFHAVARYSAMYWHNVYNVYKDKNGYYSMLAEVQERNEAAGLKSCAYCDVIKADALGGLRGALFGPVGIGVGAGVASAAAVLF